MLDDRRKLLKLLSLCMSYPDDDFFNSIGEIELCLNSLDQPIPVALKAFIGALRAQSRLKLQEHYTAVFDLNPETSLNLTFHLIGDGEERGRWLADLRDTYRQFGFETAVNELPDYLPLVLEFLSEMPDESTSSLLRRLTPAAAVVARNVEKTESIYGSVLRLACSLMPDESRTPAVSTTGSRVEPAQPSK